MLDHEAVDKPPLQDVTAFRTSGPEGATLVVVDGVWSAAAGGPPPVLFVDDGRRRHALAALDAPPQDDPTSFRATFAVPAALVGRLGEGLALGLGRSELPIALSVPGAADPWPEVVAGAPDPVVGEPEVVVPPRRRFDRGAEEEGQTRGSIAAAILRATTPPPAPGATVVERSVIAERRARRSEQLAAVMERRARGAEDTAQELGERITALEARIAEVTAEYERLSAQLELQRAATEQAQTAREDAEARLGQLLDAQSAPAAEPARAARDDIAAVRRLPGLEAAARAMREQEPAAPTPAVPAGAPDPFADALAKLRSNGEIAAAVAPRVVAEPQPVAAATELAAVIAGGPLPEHVVPYLISAEHPRTPWLSQAIRALDRRDREAAAHLVAALLPDQARTTRRPLVYDLDLEGLGPLRVELGAEGAGRVTPRSGESPDASFALQATPAELSLLAGGGAPLFPSGLRTTGARRLFLPLTRVARGRRRHVTLAELVAAGLPLDPGLAVRALASAVPPDWTAGHAFAVTVSVTQGETCRVLVADGSPLQVHRVDEAGRRSVVAATTLRRPESVRVPEGWDAVLGVSRPGALPLLAQAEPPEREEPATVIGDLVAATTLLGWFDRVQGLTPRA